MPLSHALVEQQRGAVTQLCRDAGACRVHLCGIQHPGAGPSSVVTAGLCIGQRGMGEIDCPHADGAGR